MPTYQYACTNCGETLEVVQKFSDDPLTECPSCRGRLRKVFSSVGIVFKGSGFYRTDSRTDAASKNGGEKKSAEKAPSAQTSGTTSGESSSSSSTTAAKAAAN
ncbi:MAG: FmdB family transcriptional regulator [Acidothermus sp.]|nr:FmdB family transcriptional regulator [Acidothermus sp.]MCL6538406.1 FmdB family transcriptional regulator [Acidothermus sp.]